MGVVVGYVCGGELLAGAAPNRLDRSPLRSVA